MRPGAVYRVRNGRIAVSAHPLGAYHAVGGIPAVPQTHRVEMAVGSGWVLVPGGGAAIAEVAVFVPEWPHA